MELNDLLRRENIAPETVIVMRHRPREPRLQAVLPWLVEENHTLFNTYQQTQGPTVEKAFQSAEYLASFIGTDNGKAVLAGLYKIGKTKKMAYQQFWAKREHIELYEKFGLIGMENKRGSCLWFDLKRTNHFEEWRGKLVICWPGMALSFWRWASRNKFDVFSICEESVFVKTMPRWAVLVVSHAQLETLPRSWREELSRWRGIYYILDTADGKGYVGAAYGEENIYQRWILGYSKSGDGGNKLLKGRDASGFRYSILQILPHDMLKDDVQRVEETWKRRLHTREFGLNAGSIRGQASLMQT